MSNVTWWKLTETQKKLLGELCKALRNLPNIAANELTLMSFRTDAMKELSDAGLIEYFKNRERYYMNPTAAGLEVYAQRNAAPAPPPTDALTAVWQSTAALYERFGLKPTVTNTTMVFSEEIAELLHAALLESPVNTALEAADVIVTALGVCMARGVTLDEVEAFIAVTVAKNDAKTHETHAVNAAGKIARKAAP